MIVSWSHRKIRSKATEQCRSLHPIPKNWYIQADANASGSAILIRKNLLPVGAFVTHVTTCQGRDHVVTISAGESVVVIVNVRFEPNLVLRELRERLRRISPHWQRYYEVFLRVFWTTATSASQKREDST